MNYGVLLMSTDGFEYSANPIFRLPPLVVRLYLRKDLYL